jgi:hypothetical protein
MRVTTAALLVVLASSTHAQAPNELTSAEREAGWKLLFDGKSLRGWHALGFSKTPEGLWTVRDGAITKVEKGKGPVQADGQPLEGVDLISDAAFQDFELRWDWKIDPGGNSGLKYNVSEKLSSQMAPSHAAKGFEYQLLDDEKAEDNKLAHHRAGSLYDLFAPGDWKKVHPAGQWNQSALVFRGNHGEHWLNGAKVLEFDLGTPRMDAALAASKYHTYPAWFGERRKGQIVIQDHGDVVQVRSIKIRELAPAR